MRHLLKKFIREAISKTPELPRRIVMIDDHKIDCEVADTDPARLKGLMHRQELQQGKGMLFVFPWQDAQSFWMRDTHIPLDIAFVDARGKILNIETGEPLSEAPIKSVSPAMYVLEVPKGWFSLRRLEPGSIVSFGE